MAGNITPDIARDLVQHITEKHGYVEEETLQGLDPESRRRIIQALRSKDLMIGNMAITLAKDLYSYKSRFIFELLQNADDNYYTRARGAGAEPRVSFEVYPDKIIVESNEDGFTEEDLAAICAVGRSSKTGKEGYIGEKGIGFKSVFIPACKVHIQSGAFSFSFCHRPGDTGMGMITPVWEESRDDDLPQDHTRMILYLHKASDGDAALIEATRMTTVEQFRDLQGVFLLFMKNLRSAKVSFFGDDGCQTSSTAYAIKELADNITVLDNFSADGTNNQYFKTVTYQVEGLAKHDNREYSPAELTVKTFSKSTVVLAFPVTRTSTPIIQPCDLFVFLPVRPVGFNFIIHADLVTSANRQDIIYDSPRNRGLIDAIGSAFIKAIVDFSTRPKPLTDMFSQWMRYLPDEHVNRDPLWSALVENIRQKLRDVQIIYTQSKSFVAISEARRLPDSFLHNDGTPLFVGEASRIVSQMYDRDDLDILQRYGLTDAHFGDFLKWLKMDLASPESRMRSIPASDDWHTHVAKCLFDALTHENTRVFLQQVCQIPLVPLSGGQWVCQKENSLYFPQAQSVKVPCDIGIQIISEDAIASNIREALFDLLGAKRATDMFVHSAILEKYRNKSFAPSLAASVQHYRTLYRTHHLVEDAKHLLPVYTSTGLLITSTDRLLYSKTDDPYGPYEICKKIEPEHGMDSGAPGYPIDMINDAYLEDEPEQLKGQSLSWNAWLTSRLGISVYIDLNSTDYKTLIPYVQDHRPKKLFGMVKNSWKKTMEVQDSTIDLLRKTQILCRTGEYRLWKDTYFPTCQMERAAEKFLGPDNKFPFLWIDEQEPIHETVPFYLQKLLSCLQDGLFAGEVGFVLEMLRCKVNILPRSFSAAERSSLFSMYEHIFVQSTHAMDPDEYIQRTRDEFSSSPSIFVPLDAKSHTWALPEECVWDSTVGLLSKHTLRHLYKPYGVVDEVTGPSVKSLFTKILQIPTCTWHTYVEELKVRNEEGNEDAKSMAMIYKTLRGLSRLTSTDKDTLRIRFKTDALIYVPLEDEDSPKWLTTSECVWSSTSKLRKHVSLRDHYPDLEDFFVDVLGVSRVNLSTVVMELEDGAKEETTTVAEIKEMIRTVNSQLLCTSTGYSIDQLDPNLKVFPVIDTEQIARRVTASTVFFVVDREPLREAFAGTIRLLDFTVKEVSQLGPFLRWAGIEDRLLSKQVQECTILSNDSAIGRASTREKQIRQRAHALLRIAAHFRSPRTMSSEDMTRFYEELRTVCVYETDHITSSFQLVQDERTIRAEDRRANLYIEEKRKGADDEAIHFDIYLPNSAASQNYVVMYALPRKLFQWMMTPPLSKTTETSLQKDGIEATKNILLAPPSMLSHSLDDCGIASIDIDNIDDELHSDDGDGIDDNNASQRHIPSITKEDTSSREESTLSTPREGNRTFNSNRLLASPGAYVETPQTERSEAENTPVSNSRSTRSSTQTSYRQKRRKSDIGAGGDTAVGLSPDQLRNYNALIDKAVSAAKSYAFPGRGIHGMQDMAASLPQLDGIRDVPVDFGLDGLSSLHKNSLIGAVGELFVFELISKALSPRGAHQFTLDNWRSKMRHRVRTHPDYADMTTWSGWKETADIVYEDENGYLTDLLVDTGHLGAENRSLRAIYNIEVKTTPSTRETPFYIGEDQYKLLRNGRLQPGETVLDKHIYVLFRVFKLGYDDIGVEVYVDPDSFREQGKITVKKCMLVLK